MNCTLVVKVGTDTGNVRKRNKGGNSGAAEGEQGPLLSAMTRAMLMNDVSSRPRSSSSQDKAGVSARRCMDPRGRSICDDVAGVLICATRELV